VEDSESLWERGLRLERLGDIGGAIVTYREAAEAGEEPQEARAGAESRGRPRRLFEPSASQLSPI
jgi:hypothetical protein